MYSLKSYPVKGSILYAKEPKIDWETTSDFKGLWSNGADCNIIKQLQ